MPKPPLNAYRILGVTPTATHDDIKRAYRKLSLKHHPDKTKNDPELTKSFHQIKEAYQILSDSEKRKEHDKHIYHVVTRQSSHPSDMDMNSMTESHTLSNMVTQWISSLLYEQDRSDSVEEVSPDVNHTISTRFHKYRNKKPTAIVCTIQISMSVVWSGGKEPLPVQRWIVQEDGLKVTESVMLYVSIEKGVDDNELIVLPNQGNVVSDDCKGDVKVFIKVINNSLFIRQGLDLYYDHTLSLEEALCGFRFQLPTHFNGRAYTINNEPGNIIKPQFIKTIPELGLQRDGCIGSLHIRFSIEFPTQLSMKTLQLLQAVFRIEGRSPAAPIEVRGGRG